MKMMVPKASKLAMEKKKRNGENEKLKIKKSAKGLGMILRSGQLFSEARKTSSTEYRAENTKMHIKDELFEIPIKKIGQGELFGHDDILNNRNEYSVTIKCISLNAKIYEISREVLYIYIYI